MNQSADNWRSQPLKDALEAIKDLAGHINRSVENQHQTSAILALQEQFYGQVRSLPTV